MTAHADIRTDQSLEQGFQLEELRIDPTAGEVAGPCGREKLDPKVMAVLVLMAQHAGHVVSREELHARLWPNAVVTDDALTRCFYELRRHLSQAGGSDRYKAMLETLPKRGYRLNGKVTSSVPEPGARPRDRPNRRFKAAAIAIVISMAIAVLLLIFIGQRFRESPDDSQSPAATTAPNSIAVLPFLDMSAGQDQGYLSDGIAEEILNRLTQAGRLRVISRTSSFSFRDRPVEIREIAAKLNVSHVLEGSVRRSGDSIRITAQLIAASDNSHVWSETYDRERGDLFAVQDEIAASVATALQVTLAGGAPHGRMPASVEAYERFLQGNFFTIVARPVTSSVRSSTTRTPSPLILTTPGHGPPWPVRTLCWPGTAKLPQRPCKQSRAKRRGRLSNSIRDLQSPMPAWPSFTSRRWITRRRKSTAAKLWRSTPTTYWCWA